MFVVSRTFQRLFSPHQVRGDKTPPLPGELLGTIVVAVVKGRGPATPETIIPVYKVLTVWVQSVVLWDELGDYTADVKVTTFGVLLKVSPYSGSVLFAVVSFLSFSF